MNFKYMSTKRLKDILEHPHCQGIDGKDYEPYKESLELIYWERMERVESIENDRILRELDNEI